MIRPLRRAHRRVAWIVAAVIAAAIVVGWRAHADMARARALARLPALPGEVAR